jgi:hypothetical protein
MYRVILEIYMLLMGQVWHTETEQRWNYVFVHVLPAYFSFNMSFFLRHVLQLRVPAGPA